jgi:UDPglucose 6-dehydrogenase
MKIGVIGCGRLGLAFALMCDKHGIPVIASDKNSQYIRNLNNGIVFTNEPKIPELLLNKRFIEFTESNEEVIEKCDYIWTFVETPSLVDGSYDVTKVWGVVDQFKKIFEQEKSIQGKTFVVGCTTNPGDCDLFDETLRQYSVNVVYNPEFVAQGEIVNGFENADMVLLGMSEGQDLKILMNLYRVIGGKDMKFNVMSLKAAELTKISINCFLTMKISYANMIGEIAIKTGLENEVDLILKSIGSDSRIGNKFLKYGFGFGGPCFPRDNRSLGNHAKKHGANSKISDIINEMNNDHTEFLAEYYVSKNPNKLTPFVMKNISYKRGTDILVDSQQYNLCLKLLSLGYTVHVQEVESVISQFKMKDMSEIGGRLKFFRYGTKPEGYLIDL